MPLSSPNMNFAKGTIFRCSFPPFGPLEWYESEGLTEARTNLGLARNAGMEPCSGPHIIPDNIAASICCSLPSFPTILR